jgi:hypothetical protein
MRRDVIEAGARGRERVLNCTAGRLNFFFSSRGASLSREIALQKGEPVVVVFFGENPVRGVVEDVDKTKALIAFGRGAWTITAPRAWIRQQENDWVVDLG